MINFTKVDSTEQDSLTRRIIKFLRLGKSDTQTSLQASPHGIDSNPVKDMVAIYMKTGVQGESVIVGYLNKNQIAETGETRLYATNASGTEQFHIHMKSTGVCEFDGDEIQFLGQVHNLARYMPINAGLQAQAALINSNYAAILVNLAALNVAVNILLPGSVPTPYVPVPVTVDIAAANNDKLKCN